MSAPDGRSGARRIERAIRAAGDSGHLALAPFLTAGYPDRAGFADLCREVGRVADVLEIGVPFSDPMADGVTIQRSSRAALASGVDLEWILSTLDTVSPELPPTVLMSYLNPLLAFGIERLSKEAAQAGVSGLIVPDLPYEESGELARQLRDDGLALIQLVTPVTCADRLQAICEAGSGFIYAVTAAGTTGGEVRPAYDYLDQVRSLASVPVLAGFGIRTVEQLQEIAGHADGVIVGSALIEAIDRGDPPARFLGGLRPRVAGLAGPPVTGQTETSQRARGES